VPGFDVQSETSRSSTSLDSSIVAIESCLNTGTSASCIMAFLSAHSVSRIASRVNHGALNIAPTGSLLFKVIEHVGLESGTQFTDQPPKVEPGEGTAVNVTDVPST